MNASNVHTIAEAFLAAALLFLGGAYWRQLAKRDAKVAADAASTKSLQEQLSALQNQMQLLGIAVQPLTAAMAAMLVKSLTHFHTPEVDELLAKVGPPNTLSAAEEQQLGAYMRKRMRDMAVEITPLERNAAQMLPLVIERNRLESVGLEELGLKLVGIPKDHE
jgi:hypothetical protein